jgi:hypothetical protein
MTTTKQKTNLKFATAMMLAGASIVSSLYAIAVINQGYQGQEDFRIAAVTSKTYYIDSVAGNDTKTGLSEANAWKTFNNLGGKVFNAGDKILLKKGSTFKARLNVYGVGTVSNPIVISSYGSGNRPVIDGEGNRDFNLFIDGSQYVNVSDVAVKRAKSDAGPSAGVAIVNSNYVTLDNVEVTENFGSGGVYIYVSDSSKGVGNVIKNSTISNTKGTAFTGQDNRGNGIFLWADCVNCGGGNIISNNTITGNGDHGVGVFFGGNTVAKNTISSNGNAGVTVGGDKAVNNIIEGNTISQNCKATDDCFGINLFRVGTGNIVRYNVTDGQHDTLSDTSISANPGNYGPSKYGTGGIRFDGGAPNLALEFGVGWDYTDSIGNKIYYNQISNEIDGIQIYNHSNVEISNNTIYNSKRSGISAAAYNTVNNLFTQNITITLRNNLLFGLDSSLLNKPGLRSSIEPNYALLVLGNAVGASNNNLFFPNNNLAIKFNGNVPTRPLGDTGRLEDGDGIVHTSYTLTNWQNTTNQDRQSVVADPLFEGAPSNLRITANSPAVDKGASVGLTADIVGAVVPQGNAVDIGAYETKPVPKCVESWTCESWTECNNSSQSRNCTDANNCGTTEFRPELTQSCAMPVCEENWTCGDWGACVNGNQSRTCNDANTCGTITNRPVLSQACTVACIPSCSGKNCGADGCGGTCGTCGANQQCNTAGTCQAVTPTYDNAYCSSKYGKGYTYDSGSNKCCKTFFGRKYSCKNP